MKAQQKSFFSLKYSLRLFHTLKYLRWEQVFYRLYYPLKRTFFRPGTITVAQLAHAQLDKNIDFQKFSINNNLNVKNENSFTFLNRSKFFGDGIDWEFSEYGLLWSFNLHYFNWLNDEKNNCHFCLSTINQYIDSQNKEIIFIHSFPASLRIVNWIKFLIKNKIKDERIISNLYQQTDRLAHFPEYEILGNHLLENGIALVWAGLYFGEQRFARLGQKIVHAELKEQILPDGAHFEKSISYHTILLKNILELCFFVEQTEGDEKFVNQLKYKYSLMLSHLFVLGDRVESLPYFGDGNIEMTIRPEELLSLAQNLRVFNSEIELNKSGIRKLFGAGCELFFNSGNITSSYQPGHTHSDVFTFCLNWKGKPIVVDRGISTYERSVQRSEERSTKAHNTVCVEGENVSDIWATFRIGKRASIYTLEDVLESICFEHDGYFSKYKIKHRRTINSQVDVITIKDELLGWKGQELKLYLHFHPDLIILKKEDKWIIEGTGISIEILNAETYTEHYLYCWGFNKTQSATRIVGTLNKEKAITYIRII